MRKAVQGVRITAVAVGVIAIIGNIILQIWNYTVQIQFIYPDTYPMPTTLTNVFNLINSIFSFIIAPITINLILILLALLVNPDKVVALFKKRKAEPKEEPALENGADNTANA